MLNPCRARESHKARPMPDEPPVTTAQVALYFFFKSDDDGRMMFSSSGNEYVTIQMTVGSASAYSTQSQRVHGMMLVRGKKAVGCVCVVTIGVAGDHGTVSLGVAMGAARAGCNADEASV